MSRIQGNVKKNWDVLTETRRKIFKINKELTASVVIIEMFEEKMMASSCVFPIIEAKWDLFPWTDLNN